MHFIVRRYQVSDRAALRAIDGMDEFARSFHLFASSFHPLGMAFYCRLRLQELGRFEWRFHNGVEWLNVTDTIFGLRLK